MRRGSVVAGGILILIGVLAILQFIVRAFVPSFHIMWIFWPVVLIVLGVWMLRGFRWGRGREVEREDSSVPLDGATEAAVRVHHGAGRLSIGSGAAPGDLLTGTFGGGLDAQSSRSGARLSVEMRIKDRDVANYFTSWTRGRHGALDWDFRLAQGIPLDLVLETGANEARLALTDLSVRELTVKTGASATTVELPARAGRTRVRVESGAASVRLRVPAGVSALIRVNAALSGTHVDEARFPRSGDSYRSPDFDAAANRVEITVDSGVGSIDVR
jgi:hypothetical protein